MHVWSFAVQPEVDWTKNLALRKPTKQSTVNKNGLSGRAVDGNTDSNFSSNSCTQTANTKGNWWQVDLGSVYDIREVAVTNRGDCCGTFNVIYLYRIHIPYIYIYICV